MIQPTQSTTWVDWVSERSYKAQQGMTQGHLDLALPTTIPTLWSIASADSLQIVVQASKQCSSVDPICHHTSAGWVWYPLRVHLGNLGNSFRSKTTWTQVKSLVYILKSKFRKLKDFTVSCYSQIGITFFLKFRQASMLSIQMMYNDVEHEPPQFPCCQSEKYQRFGKGPNCKQDTRNSPKQWPLGWNTSSYSMSLSNWPSTWGQSSNKHINLEEALSINNWAMWSVSKSASNKHIKISSSSMSFCSWVALYFLPCLYFLSLVRLINHIFCHNLTW